MNATSLYVTTCRLVMTADPEQHNTWTELYKLLPYLRQSLSCTVCGKLLCEPHTPSETPCQHHVCRKCLGGKKRLKPACSCCKDYTLYVDNVQVNLVVQCYRKLCEYIKFTPIYCKLCSIYSNGGQLSLVDMINEAVDNTNKCDETNSVHCEHDIDNKETITLPLTDGLCASTTTVCSAQSLPTRELPPPPAPPPSPQPPPPPPPPPPLPPVLRPPQTQTSLLHPVPLITSSVQSLAVPQTLHPVTSVATPVSSQSQSSSLLSTVKAVTPSLPPAVPPAHHYPLQTVAATTTTVTTTNSGVSGIGFAPGTIFPSTNLVKQVVKEISIPKHNSSVNNGSSIYSVMYTDGDSTKITIKRKPPEIDNSNKPVSLDPEVVPTGNQELIKKPKPKPKPKPKRKGCRCGNATPTPGKLTCCGQRCPCYVEAKACIECRCRGCRNPHRPGGKKVRPVIPQLANIQIHQVQPVHGRSMASSMPNNVATTCPGTLAPPPPVSSAVITSTTIPQTIRAMQAMHAVQAVHGVSSVQAVASGVHQLISLGGGMVQNQLNQLSPGLGVNPVAGLAVKPVSLALTSVPAQLLINDDRSTSNSEPDNSDVEVDI